MDLIKELEWRGMIHDIIPGTEDYLSGNNVKGYVGFDPTAPSLGIGNMVAIMLLVHLQRAGHTPIALVGGATGRVGDPSGKKEERKLMTEDELQHNQEQIRKQLERFLHFDGSNAAVMRNNYDWFKDWSFLDFIRDVGKHITINYMMSKDSVKNRLESGLSFTEFTYQLLQAYDFLHLYREEGCKLQLGGSDQWGNITTGSELIRRLAGGEAYAITCPLITKSDGSKFGKSEKGNIWLDPEMTSPYQFYQFWINVADEDVIKFYKIFSIRDREEMESHIRQQENEPGRNYLQYQLADEVTEMVHGKDALEHAKAASKVMFGNSSKEDFLQFSVKELNEIFEGIDQGRIARSEVEGGVPVADLFAITGATPSKGEARRTIKGGGARVNKERVEDETLVIDKSDLLHDRFIILQTGKKKYFIVEVE